MSEDAILQCTSCGVTWMSPFARETVRRESACLACGGPVAWMTRDALVVTLEGAAVDQVGTVIDVWRALNKRDRKTLLASLDPQVDWSPDAEESPDGRAYRGHDDVGEWLDLVERRWTHLHWDWTDVRVRDSKVAVVGTMTVHPGECASLHTPAGWLWRLRERSVVSMHATADAERMLADFEHA